MKTLDRAGLALVLLLPLLAVAAPPVEAPASPAIAEPAAVADEVFPDFFQKFIVRKSFAVSRTRYPLPVTREQRQAEKGREVIREIQGSLSAEDDARLPVLGLQIATQSLKASYGQPEQGRLTVSLQKADGSGVLTEFRFALQGGLWYLESLRESGG